MSVKAIALAQKKLEERRQLAMKERSKVSQYDYKKNPFKRYLD